MYNTNKNNITTDSRVLNYLILTLKIEKLSKILNIAHNLDKIIRALYNISSNSIQLNELLDIINTIKKLNLIDNETILNTYITKLFARNKTKSLSLKTILYDDYTELTYTQDKMVCNINLDSSICKDINENVIIKCIEILKLVCSGVYNNDDGKGTAKQNTRKNINDTITNIHTSCDEIIVKLKPMITNAKYVFGMEIYDDHITELYNKITEIVTEISYLVPKQLKDLKDTRLNHRNNLFIALSSIGYINTKLLQNNINNNLYLNIKLKILEIYKTSKQSFPISNDFSQLNSLFTKIYKFQEDKDIFDIDTNYADEYNTTFITTIAQNTAKSTGNTNIVPWSYPLFNNKSDDTTIYKNIILKIIEYIINEITKKAKALFQKINIPDTSYKILAQHEGDSFETLIKYNQTNLTEIVKILEALNPYCTFNGVGDITKGVGAGAINYNDKIFGNLINKLLNKLALLETDNTFTYRYIYELFKYYIFTQHYNKNYIVLNISSKLYSDTDIKNISIFNFVDNIYDKTFNDGKYGKNSLTQDIANIITLFAIKDRNIPTNKNLNELLKFKAGTRFIIIYT